MRNLVTGGAGFIGSNLCKYLLERGEGVVCVDDLSSGRVKNIKELEEYHNFKFIRHDITIPIDLNIERIYNLACPASPPFYQADPIKTTKTNFIGTLNMLELARTHGARILQASTSEIYGDPLEHPQREQYWGNVNPIGIRSCYDEGKRIAETLSFDYHRTFNLEIKVIRIFNTYGPNMRPDDGRVISNLIVQALTGKPLSIYGSGLQTRSFCYIDDLVKGIVTVMDSDSSIRGPFNLGNPHEFTILEFVELLSNVLNKDLEIEFATLPADDPKQRKPDINLISSTLQWQPVVTLNEGIKKTIEYFREQLSIK